MDEVQGNEQRDENNYDVAVTGGGRAGLSSGFYLRRSGLRHGISAGARFSRAARRRYEKRQGRGGGNAFGQGAPTLAGRLRQLDGVCVGDFDRGRSLGTENRSGNNRVFEQGVKYPKFQQFVRHW